MHINEKHVVDRLPKDEFENLLDKNQTFCDEAKRLLAVAKTEAEKYHQKIQSETDRQNKHAENLLETQQELFAESLVAKRGAQAILDIIANVEAVRREFDALTPWLTRLVDQSVCKIIGTLDAPELVARCVAETMRAMVPSESILLRTHPDGYKAADAAMRAYPDRFVGVRSLISDESMTSGQLFLETDGGFADIAVQSQLGAVLQALESTKVEPDP